MIHRRQGYTLRMPNNLFDIEYRAAGKFLFQDREWHSTIPEKGETFATFEGPKLLVVNTKRQPKLSQAIVDCEWM